MQCCTLDWILEQKENTNENVWENPVKSVVWLPIMFQCQFLSFDKYAMIMYTDSVMGKQGGVHVDSQGFF